MELRAPSSFGQTWGQRRVEKGLGVRGRENRQRSEAGKWGLGFRTLAPSLSLPLSFKVACLFFFKWPVCFFWPVCFVAFGPDICLVFWFIIALGPILWADLIYIISGLNRGGQFFFVILFGPFFGLLLLLLAEPRKLLLFNFMQINHIDHECVSWYLWFYIIT